MPSIECLKMTSLKSLWDKDKFEVTLRVGIMCICGFSLSIAVIPTIVPPSQSLMPGMIACTVSQVLPTVMYTIGIVIPLILVVFVGLCGCATMLLAAATVSDGCFMGVYAVFTLFMTALYFGKYYSLTSGTANLFIALGGLLGLTFAPLVQQGGLSAVADMWKESGTENQLAVWRNFLIATCWAFACVILGILVPPWRTSRYYISRGLFPSIFKQVNGVLSGDNINVAALAKSKTALKGGNVVMTTVFEPRLLHFYVDLVTPLKQIAVATDDLIFKSLLVLKFKEGLTAPPNEVESVVLQDTMILLDECAAALASNDGAHYNTLRDFVDDKVFDRMAKVGSTKQIAQSESPELSNSNYIYQQALKVRAPTLSYLRAFNRGVVTKTANEKMVYILKRAILHVAIPLLPSFQLMKTPGLIFQPKRWNFTAIMWCIELTAGFVALISMSLYWGAYNDFRINLEDNRVGAGK